MKPTVQLAMILLLSAPPSWLFGQTTTELDSVLVLGRTLVRSPARLLEECFGVDSVNASVVGLLDAARPPLPGLQTTGIASEFTFTITELEFVQCVLWDGTDFGGISYTFDNGRFRLYQDASPDADLLHPETYEDGDLLLEGDATLLTGMYSCPYFCPYENASWITFTGGSWFPHVSRDGVGYTAVLVHQFQNTSDLDSALVSMGYQFPGAGWMNVYVPVNSAPATWGRIKNLYR